MRRQRITPRNRLNNAVGIQLPHLWAIIVGQQEAALDAVKHVGQPFVVAFLKAGAVVFFGFKIWRIAIKQRVFPVIGFNQMLKGKVLNYDPAKPFLHCRERCRNVADAFRSRCKCVAVCSKAGLNKV